MKPFKGMSLYVTLLLFDAPVWPGQTWVVKLIMGLLFLSPDEALCRLCVKQ